MNWSIGHLSKDMQPSATLYACPVSRSNRLRDTACKTCPPRFTIIPIIPLARAQPSVGLGVLPALHQIDFQPAARTLRQRHKEHEGAQEMAPTPQHFCSACHGDLHTRLPNASIGDAADFGRAHPEFRPTLISGWSGERPQQLRLALAQRPQEASGLKFPHALHLSKLGGPAQMHGGWDWGRHSTVRLSTAQPTAHGSCRSRWSGTGVCHASIRPSGGRFARAHGDPAQVVGSCVTSKSCALLVPPILFPSARRLQGAVPMSAADPVRTGRSPPPRRCGYRSVLRAGSVL